MSLDQQDHGRAGGVAVGIDQAVATDAELPKAIQHDFGGWVTPKAADHVNREALLGQVDGPVGGASARLHGHRRDRQQLLPPVILLCLVVLGTCSGVLIFCFNSSRQSPMKSSAAP